SRIRLLPRCTDWYYQSNVRIDAFFERGAIGCFPFVNRKCPPFCYFFTYRSPSNTGQIFRTFPQRSTTKSRTFPLSIKPLLIGRNSIHHTVFRIYARNRMLFCTSIPSVGGLPQTRRPLHIPMGILNGFGVLLSKPCSNCDP